MAEAGSYSEARSGNWLWALLVGATLLLMEFILLAALVPTAWSERVRDTELAWLHEGLGPRTATAVVQRAEDWYGALFALPAIGVPVVGALMAVLLGVTVANSQKRL